MKKLLGIMGICIFFMLQSQGVQASTTDIYDVDEATLNRVYEELQSGEITSHEDVIKVAIAQRIERENNNVTLLSRNNGINEETLHIDQIINTWEDDEGHVYTEILSTSLILVDSEENLITPFGTSAGSGQVTGYEIYAYMNVSTTTKDSNTYVKLNWFSTTLIYGTTISASKLTQTGRYTTQPWFETMDKSQVTTSPSGNTAYYYYPTYTDYCPLLTLGCGWTVGSVVNVGSTSYTLIYDYSNSNPNGAWS